MNILSAFGELLFAFVVIGILRKIGFKGFVILVVMAFFFLGIVFFAALSPSKAQGYGTGFLISCESESYARIKIVVDSNEYEQYSIATNGGITTTIPETFTTHPGKYVLGEIDATFGMGSNVYFVSKDGSSGLLTITPDYLLFCDHDDFRMFSDDRENPGSEATSEPSVEATPTPYSPQSCSSFSIDGSTGKIYCFIARPDGVIPLPPPYSGQ